ncbi:hypothetical protein [Natronoarchaeum rubrum]|uniref:hypothetical protein n=1 Tax=Natronoarchaeum rubrum TaxID=755311 RepID=UPI0021136B21|nr:hypothetical protein [Natronoarchaeum rubrum]
MSANATVTASDFWNSLRGVGRLVYDEIIPVSIISLAATVLAVPLLTIGPICIAAVATMTEIAERRGSARARSERERARTFPAAIRRYFRPGLPFSVLICFTVLNLVTYVLLATANGSVVFWLGAALALYTLIAVVALTFRAGSLLVRAEEPPGTRALISEAVDVWLRSPWYSLLHLLVAGMVFVVMLLVTPAAMLLLAGTLAALEVVVFADLAGDGAGQFFEQSEE